MNTLLAIWEYQGMEESTRKEELIKLFKRAVNRTIQSDLELKETSDNTPADDEASECQGRAELDCENCGNDPSLAEVD